MDRFRTRRGCGAVHVRVAAPRLRARLRLAWPRPVGLRGATATGDLRFDGRIRADGPDWRLSAWLSAELREELLQASGRGPAEVRVAAGHLTFHAPGRAGAEGGLPDRETLNRWASGLTRAATRLLLRAGGDPDPRVRALAAQRLLGRLRDRSGAGIESALMGLLASPGLPDWIQLEAFLRLWRQAPAARGRWAELALAHPRSSLRRVATQAVLWSEVPLSVLVQSDPGRAAAEIDVAWRRGTHRERARLRERIEDLEASQWRRIQLAGGHRAKETFARLDEARRGALSLPDLLGGGISLLPGDDGFSLPSDNE